MRPTAASRVADSPAEVARPFLWIAAIFFSAGFWGYLALAPLLGR